MAVAHSPRQPMASSSSPRGCGHGYAEGALGREPPGRVFWSGGLGLWAPGTRWEAMALTAWLRRSAKDRHCLSVGPHYSLPDWGVDFSPPCLPAGSQGKGKHSYLPQMLPGHYLIFLLTAQRDWCCSCLCFMNGVIQLSEVKSLAQSYTARKWQSLDLNPLLEANGPSHSTLLPGAKSQLGSCFWFFRGFLFLGFFCQHCLSASCRQVFALLYDFQRVGFSKLQETLHLGGVPGLLGPSASDVREEGAQA